MFKIVYHYLVVQKDIPELPIAWKTKIKKAIESRLIIEPNAYGKPLRRSLKNYRKLRVGDYRVIFKIEWGLVKILIIKHRSVVYLDAERRIK